MLDFYQDIGGVPNVFIGPCLKPDWQECFSWLYSQIRCCTNMRQWTPHDLHADCFVWMCEGGKENLISNSMTVVCKLITSYWWILDDGSAAFTQWALNLAEALNQMQVSIMLWHELTSRHQCVFIISGCVCYIVFLVHVPTQCLSVVLSIVHFQMFDCIL